MTSGRVMNTLKFTLGEMLKNAREKKGMTRTSLAKFSGISPNSLVKYEKAQEPGGKIPGLLNMVKLARILEIDPRWIFQRISERLDPLSFETDSYSFVQNFKSDEEINADYNHSVASTAGILAGEYTNFRKDLEEIKQLIKENGPDHDGPSRSQKTTNETKAVGAAPISQKDGGD